MGNTKLAFTEEERSIDESLGYPKAYAKLCRNANVLNPYNQGPPFSFVPYMLQPQEAMRVKEMNEMFPVIDPEAVPSVNPRNFVNLLWKQLDHLGNAGFDPSLFRIDPYGNVLYLHADSASPLAWDIDHWFPCARGGKTVPSNLRIIQTQVCKKKQNKLEFLIPWWDLQLGISVNQFLSIFSSKNSDFRNRAFSFLFVDGGNEELNAVQTVESHAFPQHFTETKKKLGLAPSAIVSLSARSSDTSVLRQLDFNRSVVRPTYPLIAARKFSGEKDENENPDQHDTYNTNPHLTIAMARDSLRQRDEAKKKQNEMEELENEIYQLKEKNEEERVNIQDLESLLIKKRRRVEKCRRLAEAQSSYKSLLEKMIRDAMHQSVVYKEQLRLNQAATSALMVRLEAQRAICDSSETELRRKFKQRDEIENQIKPFYDQARKRSRTDDSYLEERYNRSVKSLPTRRIRKPLKKELRLFLEEEQRASEAGLSLGEEELEANLSSRNSNFKGDPSVREKLEQLAIRELKGKSPLITTENSNFDKRSLNENGQIEEEQEYMNKIGKGNVEKWLQLLMENTEQELDSNLDQNQTETMIGNRKSFDIKGLPRSDSSARAFRSLPSSPSKVIMGMRKGVDDCIGRRPKVIGDDEDYAYLDLVSTTNFNNSNINKNSKFVRSCSKAI